MEIDGMHQELKEKCVFEKNLFIILFLVVLIHR